MLEKILKFSIEHRWLVVLFTVGAALAGAPTVNGLGQILSGTVEQSNVDLGKEFVDMIITQRAFQANSRAITTSDEMLQELVNLKR